MTGKNTAVLLAAAGSGSRMGGGVPKQYRLLGDAPVLVKAARAFCAMDAFSVVAAAVPAEDMAYCRDLFDRYGLPGVTLTAGGATRQESVYNALKSLPQDVDAVLVHDAARPFVDEWVIRGVLDALETASAAVPCVHPKSTIRTQSETLDRNALYEVQTPQGFDRKLLEEAFRYAQETGFSGTDEAGVFEHYGKGGPVRITEGSYANYKITTPEDLPVNIRTGNGYDVHRLVPGRKLMLGCCEIPYEKVRQQVQDDLKTMHNPAKEVINEWSVYYFPHVFSEDYAAGWYDKVEAMQGKYDTYYAGEVMSFGDMDETAEYSRELVDRFF